MNWLAALSAHDQAGTACVLVTVLTARGSTPRDAGCKMVVSADAQADTIGGGALEHGAVAQARALLARGATLPLTQDVVLGPDAGQCCGGRVSVLLEPFYPPSLRIALFGAGHVGHAVIRLLADLPCRVQWFDERADAFPPDLPARIVPRHAADPAAQVAGLPRGARVLIMTHDHGRDYAITRACLSRDDLGSIGLIGSETKRARFLNRLSRDGVPHAAARLQCPIGLPGLMGKQPAEIALSVVAQLMVEAQAGSNIVPLPRSEAAR